MRDFHFDPRERTPIIKAILVGPKCSKQVRLVFDTGAALTQFDTHVIHAVGFGPSHKTAEAMMTGASCNDEQMGFIVRATKFFAVGKRFEDVEIASFNLSSLALAGIDGLLGFDLISRLHLEMDGPKGLLRIY
jgi:hypothetical protein